MEQLASFAVYMLTITSITFILAISLDLQVGHCGIVNFGQVMFLTVGAYATAIAIAGGTGVLAGGADRRRCGHAARRGDVAVRAQHERDLLGHPVPRHGGDHPHRRAQRAVADRRGERHLGPHLRSAT